jgi:hypothetical protein
MGSSAVENDMAAHTTKQLPVNVSCSMSIVIFVASVFTLFVPGIFAAEDDLFLLTVGTRSPKTAAPVTKTIGLGGGTIRTGRATVVIPAESLAQDTLVTLSGMESDNTYGTQSSQTAFSLMIETTDIRKPIGISISGVGAAAAAPYIALGDTFATGDNVARNMPALLTATPSDNGLTFSIPTNVGTPGSNPGGVNPGTANSPVRRAGDRSTYAFYHATGYAKYQSSHFELAFPQAILVAEPSIPGLILLAAERSYDLLMQMGFVFDNILPAKFPINVAYGLDERNGETELPLSGKKNQYILLNNNICNTQNLSLLQSTIGHEFFHVVQNIYDPRDALAIRHTWLKPYFLWIAEASSTWFESRVLDSTSYVPSVFADNIDMKSTGLETYGMNRILAQNLGYWASGFLRSLTDTYGTDRFVTSIWNAVGNQDASAYCDLAALSSAVGNSANTASLWRTYLRNVLSNNTGYAGWPAPSNNTGWSSSMGRSGTLRVSTAPFSGLKWPISFQTLSGPDTFWLTALTDTPSITYDLYRYNGQNQPYTHLKTLTFNKSESINAAPGEQYMVAVVNSNTTYPYTTAEDAAIRIGIEGTSRFCSVPDSIPMAITGGGYNREWDHPVRRYPIALEQFFDTTRTQISGSWCYDYDTGQQLDYYGWYSNGNMMYENHLNLNNNYNGVWKHWYQSGYIETIQNYSDGKLNGPSSDYYDGGILNSSGNWLDGKRNGTFNWYDRNGNLTYSCVFINDVGQPGCTLPY